MTHSAIINILNVSFELILLLFNMHLYDDALCYITLTLNSEEVDTTLAFEVVISESL